MDQVTIQAHNPDPVRYENGEWGFWDETWSHWYGPYDDEATARSALERYCEECL